MRKPTHSYETHRYCAHHGWIRKGDVGRNASGQEICPVCNQRVRYRVRHRYKTSRRADCI